MFGRSLVFGLTLIFGVLYWASPIWTCNEVLCGSVVSKCLLTQSCKCELKNCTCCKDCFICLDKLYSDCCSCVEMCPKPNETNNQLAKNSHVEDLDEEIPALFQALTEDPDTLERWTSFTYPAHKGVSFFKEMMHPKTVTTKEEPIKVKEEFLNCTVAYLSQCMSWNKCKASCTSMGATSYRWFHDGCCECVGKHCINYGINESRCRDCPNFRDETFNGKDYDEGPPEDEDTFMKEGSSDKVSVTSEEYSEAGV